jgi:hypothetical protein
MRAAFLLTLGPLAMLSPARGQEGGETLAWAPKPLKAVGYFGVNRPIVKIADLLVKLEQAEATGGISASGVYLVGKSGL